MKKNLLALTALMAFAIIGFAQNANVQKKQKMQSATSTQQIVERRSNEKFPQSKVIENSYPLTSDSACTKVVRIMQQITVDLLAVFNQNKEAHWNVNGSLYLQLHAFYQDQADFYRTQADLFAERALQLGYSIDGRYNTISKTTNIPDFPGGYITDIESKKLLLDRIKILQKEVYNYVRETEDIEKVTSNELQDLGYEVDKNLWKLRIHLQKPGGSGEVLPSVN